VEVDSCSLLLLLRKKRDEAAAKAQNGGARAHVGPLVVPFFHLRLRQILTTHAARLLMVPRQPCGRYRCPYMVGTPEHLDVWMSIICRRCSNTARL